MHDPWQQPVVSYSCLACWPCDAHLPPSAPAGCTLSHLGGDRVPLVVQDTANIVNTTIVDNAQFDDGDAVLYLQYSGSTAWLRGVTFARNNAPQLVLSFSGGDVYSDVPLEYYSRLDGQYVASLGAPAAGAGFLAPSDPFFQTATSVRPHCPDADSAAAAAAQSCSWRFAHAASVWTLHPARRAYACRPSLC